MPTTIPDLSHEDLPSLLCHLRAGDQIALGEIVRRLRSRMLALARHWLQRVPILEPEFQAEDAMQTCYLHFLKAAPMGEIFKDIQSEEDFLRLFRKVLACTILDQVKRAGASKRSDPALKRIAFSFSSGDNPIPQEPSVASNEREIIVQDQWDWLLRLLKPEQAELASQRRAGYTHAEIAKSRHVHVRTIERKFHEIHTIWKRAIERQDRD
jgi:DNA-directed RNA polymerase specialized sigma24 family protein